MTRTTDRATEPDLRRRARRLLGGLALLAVASYPSVAQDVAATEPPPPEVRDRIEATEPPPCFGTVTLKEEVYVKGPTICLGDIADIDGANAKSLASIEIAGAAAPGTTKRLDASLLSLRLQNSGIEADAFELDGARSVLAKTLYLDITREMIAEDLRTFIESNMPWDPRQATVDIVATAQDFVVPEGDVTLTWWPNPQYRWAGPGSFRGEVRVDGQVKRTVLCRAIVEAYVDVLVAAADIPRGATFSPSQLEVQKRAISTLRGSFLSDPADAVGKLSRNTIFPGQVITSRNLVLPQLIKRYQIVTVEVRCGSLIVHGQARALAHACAGDLLRCRNEDSDEEFTGIVREDGVVVIE
ncbi:MAG: flagellar basal body P-ring formation protein FlgA [Candidatus Hydrogenedentes bacterium]|nr:flagellar basal body P-ring formation protein FlgA [Candidatus Hydrogenedentota bacterium]